MFKTKPPESGPWIVPPDEARGMFIITTQGPSFISDYIRHSKLRENQIKWRATDARKKPQMA